MSLEKTSLTEKSLALRYNEGKVKLSYLLDFGPAMTEFCRVCMQGERKYERDNWRMGLTFRSVFDSLLRHIMAYYNGEDRDPETGCHHLAHAMWNCAVLIYYGINKPELDDRIKQ